MEGKLKKKTERKIIPGVNDSNPRAEHEFNFNSFKRKSHW